MQEVKAGWPERATKGPLVCRFLALVRAAVRRRWRWRVGGSLAPPAGHRSGCGPGRAGPSRQADPVAVGAEARYPLPEARGPLPLPRWSRAAPGFSRGEHVTAGPVTRTNHEAAELDSAAVPAPGGAKKRVRTQRIAASGQNRARSAILWSNGRSPGSTASGA